MVARSRSHSSPGCVPRGVILTFCAHAGALTADRARTSIFIPKFFICMTSSRKRLWFWNASAMSARIERRTIGLLFHIVVHKVIPFTDRLICRAAVDRGGIFLLSNEFLDEGFVFTYGVVELVGFLLGLDVGSLTRLAT